MQFFSVDLTMSFVLVKTTKKHDCDTAQGKDASRGNFLMLYADYLGRYNKI